MRAMARSSWETAVMALDMPRSTWAGMRLWLWLWWSLACSLDPATLVELALADFFLCPAVGLFLTCEYLAGIVAVFVVAVDEDH